LFYINDKMWVGVIKDEMMCRIDPAIEETVLEKNGCRPMDFTGRPMKGYVYVAPEAFKTKKQLDYWVGLCLAFNKTAKSSRKSKKRTR
jgi:hypothetical protein